MTYGCINDAVDANEEGDTLMKAANSANYGDTTPIPLIKDIISANKPQFNLDPMWFCGNSNTHGCLYHGCKETEDVLHAIWKM